DRAPDRAGGRMAKLVDRQRIGHRRGDSPRGDPGGDPRGPRYAREIVLAHRHRTGQPDGHALPEGPLDVAALAVAAVRPTSRNGRAVSSDDLSLPRYDDRHANQFQCDSADEHRVRTSALLPRTKPRNATDKHGAQGQWQDRRVARHTR